MQKKYMPDDKVQYVGSKFAKELAGGQGWIISDVRNDPGLYVVEFGSDSYLLRDTVLAPFRAQPKDAKSANEVHSIEIRRNRRRASEEETE